MIHTPPSTDLIEKAIKNAKWDRASYEYALNHMLPHRCFSDSSIYKKAELITLFYEAIQTRWGAIKDFTTFKNLT
jgi:hypothetical protein